MAKDQGRGKGNFKVLKRFLAGQQPVKLNTFLGKGDQWANKTRESLNKLIVEVSKTKEALYIFKVKW